MSIKHLHSSLVLCANQVTKVSEETINEKVNKNGETKDVAEVVDLNPPTHWPLDIKYLFLPVISPFLTDQQIKWLRRKPRIQASETAVEDEKNRETLVNIRLPLSREEDDGKIKIKIIEDENHPAFAQRGLFATRDLKPGECIIPYIGYVHSSTLSERMLYNSVNSSKQGDPKNKEGSGNSQESSKMLLKNAFQNDEHIPRIGSWDTSSYDLNLYRDQDVELAIDAAQMGNEARFCNDYRGVPAPDLVSDLSKDWDRKAKRSVKSSKTGKEGKHAGQEDINSSALSLATAIPNAEFRDVWFEWSEDDLYQDANGADHSRIISDRATKLNLSADHPKMEPPSKKDSKQARRQQRRRRSGMRGVAIFVLPAGRSGKRKHGIGAGEEVLVSYGKGFWAHHGLNDDPGQQEQRKEGHM